MSDDRGQIIAAAERTLTGPSVFGTITTTGPTPYADSFLFEPATGRCAVSLSSIFDDTMEYGGADGTRWWRRPITPGSRDARDPRTLLEQLGAGSFEILRPLEGDHHGFHLRLVGADAAVSLAARSPVSTMSTTLPPAAGAAEPAIRTWSMAWFGPPVAITMPDPAVLIDHADWVREQEEQSHR